MTTPDPTNPPHYKAGGLEAIDVIEAFDLNFRLGNVVKYALRADRKGTRLIDLKKSLWYLQREIAVEEARAALAAEVAKLDSLAGAAGHAAIDAAHAAVDAMSKPNAWQFVVETATFPGPESAVFVAEREQAAATIAAQYGAGAASVIAAQYGAGLKQRKRDRKPRSRR